MSIVSNLSNLVDHNKSPLFSIIVVTYNAEIHIEKTLQSINAQEFTDYEILIKDGCSNDNTVELAKTYAKVKIISKSDNGIYDAMNQAIGYANGEFIIFINAGDLLFSNKTLLDLENFVMEYVSSNTIIYGDIIRKGQVVKMPSKYDDFMSFRKTICHQSIFYNKKVFELIGVFDINYRISSDYEHLLRSSKEGVKFVYVRKIISCYLGDGFSEKKENYTLAINENKEIRSKYFKKKNIFIWKNINKIMEFFLQLIPKFIKNYIKNLIL